MTFSGQATRHRRTQPLTGTCDYGLDGLIQITILRLTCSLLGWLQGLSGIEAIGADCVASV